MDYSGFGGKLVEVSAYEFFDEILKSDYNLLSNGYSGDSHYEDYWNEIKWESDDYLISEISYYPSFFEIELDSDTYVVYDHTHDNGDFEVFKVKKENSQLTNIELLLFNMIGDFENGDDDIQHYKTFNNYYDFI